MTVTATPGVHNPKPRSIQGRKQAAIPPQVFGEPRTGTCVCGAAIRTSCFGWIHVRSVWARLGACTNAEPR